MLIYSVIMLNEYENHNIYIRHAIDEKPRLVNDDMHIHSRCEIYLFISGKVDYLVEGSRYPLKPDSLLIMRPSELHIARIVKAERYERFAINFPLDFMKEADPDMHLARAFLDRELGKENLFTEEQLDVKLARTLFTNMVNAKNDYERNLALKTNLPLLLYIIDKAFINRKQSEKNPPGFAEKVVSYINQHLFEEITIPELSEYFNYSPSQFTRLFKKNVGSAPWDYILRKRLTAARSLLYKGISTQNACEECGFSDYSSFYRSYVKYFNESPGKSREKNKNQFSNRG